METHSMIRALIILFIVSPLYAGMKYSYSDPKLDDELENNYKEHRYPNWVNARGSSATITFISASTISVTGLSVTVSTLTSTLTNNPSLYILKNNSGSGNENGGNIYFKNFGPSGTGRNSGVQSGALWFNFSQPTSGADQVGASIIAQADTSQSGTVTPTKLIFQTNSAASLTTALVIDSVQKSTFSGTVAFNPTTNGIVGTPTNDNAAEGIVGQYVSSSWSGVTAAASNAFSDATSISLTAGDWDIEMHAEMGVNEVANVTRHVFGVSTTSGNNAAGLTQGTTRLDCIIPGANSNCPMSLTRVRVQPTSTTTYYAKIFGTYTGTAPSSSGQITARRVR